MKTRSEILPEDVKLAYKILPVDVLITALKDVRDVEGLPAEATYIVTQALRDWDSGRSRIGEQAQKNKDLISQAKQHDNITRAVHWWLHRSSE